MTDKPQDSEWEATPTPVTLPLVGLLGPLASGSLTPPTPRGRMLPDLPTLSDLDGSYQHVQSSAQALSPPVTSPTHSGQNFQDSDRPRSCRPTPGQTRSCGRQYRLGCQVGTQARHTGPGCVPDGGPCSAALGGPAAQERAEGVRRAGGCWRVILSLPEQGVLT